MTEQVLKSTKECIQQAYCSHNQLLNNKQASQRIQKKLVSSLRVNAAGILQLFALVSRNLVNVPRRPDLTILTLTLHLQKHSTHRPKLQTMYNQALLWEDLSFFDKKNYVCVYSMYSLVILMPPSTFLPSKPN